MSKLMTCLSFVGCLVGVSQGDQIAVSLGLWLDGGGARQMSERRLRTVHPPHDRDGGAAASTPRATGFRTSHVRVPTAKPNRYDPLIERYAAQAEVPSELVRAVVRIESGFNPAARSSAGAMGLMQLMPETAAELGVIDPYDPSENIRGGVVYLKQLLMRYGGDERLALAAYNAGPGAVARYGNRVPPYSETLQYVRRVRSAARSEVQTRRSDDRVVYKSYAIEDGWWTVVYSNVPPVTGHYEVTNEVTPEDLATPTAPATLESGGRG